MIVAVLSLLALGLSFLLVPRNSEIGTIALRSAENERAERSFAERYELGDRSAPVIAGLSKLAIERGDVERAISFLRPYVDAHPRDVEALEQLAELLKQAQLPDQYLAALQRLETIRPDLERERLLAQLFEDRGNEDGVVSVLRLIAGKPGVTADELLLLARYEAAADNKRAALAALERIRTQFPQENAVYVSRFIATLLVDIGDFAKARQVAATRIDATRDVSETVAMLDVFDRRGRAADADQLLAARVAAADPDPALVAYWADRQIVAGRTGEVAGRLQALYGANPPAELLPLQIRVALLRSDLAGAMRSAQRADIRVLPDATVEQLIRALLATNATAGMQALLARLPVGWREAHPLLAAEMFLAEGKPADAATWLDRAIAAGPYAEVDDELALVRVANLLNRRAFALDRLSALTARTALPDAVLLQLARSFDDLDREVEGIELFERLRAAQPGRGTDVAWAMVAAAGGRIAEVRTWLAGQKPQELPPELLESLTQTGLRRADPALALQASEWLLLRRPDDNARLQRVAALGLAGRGAEALALLDTVNQGPETEGALRTALRQLAPHDAAAAERLRLLYLGDLASTDVPRRIAAVEGLLALHQYEAVLPALSELARTDPQRWLPALATAARATGQRDVLVQAAGALLLRTDLPRAGREQIFFALQEAGATETALPLLRQLAIESGGTWLDAYADALTKSGRTAELDRFEAERGVAAGTSLADRRNLAQRLLARGQKRAAEPVFRAVATRSREIADVEALFYLWGPRPGEDELVFAEQQARAASGAIQGVWLERLVAAKAPARAVAVWRAGSGNTDERALDSYLAALAATNARAELKRELQRAIPGVTASERLRRLMSLARNANELPAARLAADRLVLLNPDDARAQRERAMIAFEQQDWSVSRRGFEAWHAAGPGDFESNQYYAEILLKDRDAAGARPFFQRALTQVDAVADPPYRERMVRAHLLHRLGRNDEADAAYKALVAERPGDKDLVADYGTMLLELGRLRDARNLLGPR